MTCGVSTMGREPLATQPRGPWGTLLVMDMIGRDEFLSPLTMDTNAPTQILGGVFLNTMNPLAFTAGIILALDGLSPLEFLKFQPMDTNIPLGFTQGVVLTNDTNSPLEIGGGILFDTHDPLEILGIPHIIGDVLRPATPVFILIPQRPRGSS